VPETDRVAMKRDAFDDVDCPFNYKLELQKAHEALKAKVGKYVSANQSTGYRELAKKFHMSPAALCAIAKKYSTNVSWGAGLAAKESRLTFVTGSKGKNLRQS
jgi:hypothetical protein